MANDDVHDVISDEKFLHLTLPRLGLKPLWGPGVWFFMAIPFQVASVAMPLKVGLSLEVYRMGFIYTHLSAPTVPSN